MLLQALNPDNYAFSSLSMSMFLTGVAIAGFGFFVLIRERASSVGSSFLFLCLSLSLYLEPAALNIASQNTSLSLLWFKICNLGAILIPCSILVLTTTLFGLTHRYRSVIAASLALSIMFALGLFFTDLHVRRIERFSWGNYGQYGPLGYAFIGYFFTIMVLILRLYWQEYRRCATERQMKRYRGLLTAFAGGYLGSVDFLAAFGFPVYPFGYVFLGFFLIACAYVIRRYRLVDITPEVAAGRILETIQGAVIVIGMDGRIRVINSVALKIIGHPRPELIGRDLAEVLPETSEPAETVRSGVDVISREMTWEGRNGRHVVNLSASRLTVDQDNEPIGIVYAAYDITDRKRAEDALKTQEERLRMAMAATRQGWFDLNIRSGEVSVSPEYVRMIGYDPSDFRTNLQAWFEAIHPEDRDAVAKAYQQCLVCGGPCTMEYRRRTKTGEWKWILSMGRVIESDADGKPLRMTGTHADISDRKRAEETLRKSEQFNKKILDNVDEGFIVVDRDYRIMVANKAYCDQVGMSLSEVVGSYCYRVCHNHYRPCHDEGEECPIWKVFETGEAYSSNHEHIDRAGKSHYFETKALPLDRESGTVTSVIETLSDVTEKRHLEEERQKTKKLEAIGTLAGGIAHDFNNLLQGVFGYIELAKLTLDAKSKSYGALEHAGKALDRSVNLTNQLLTFSKGGKPVIKPVDLRMVMENATKFAISGSRTGHHIMADKDPWYVDANEGQISQVIQNIVLNACQAMPDGGTVELAARNVHVPGPGLPDSLQGGPYVEIAVKDAGIGIPARDIDRIFEPYFTTKEKGSGLGLATSYSIMKNHKGLISVKSAEGVGTTFLLYFPASAAQLQEERIAPATAPAEGRKGRVLIMDDEQVIRDVGCVLISALGHEADCAAHGRAAIEAFQAAKQAGKPFDVVILDLTIKGGMGGAETLHHLMELAPGVQAVVSSGYSDDAVLSDYRAHGFKAALKKPYELNDLRNILNTLLKA